MLTRTKLRTFLTLVGIIVLFSVGFQNCGNNMAFQGVDDLNSILAEKNYAEATAGDADAFPPLKLIFVVDNSGTMGINQINLSSAFGRMFSGENQNNLEPFNTTAFVLNTSQYVPEKTSSVFQRMPSQSVESFAALAADQLSPHRGPPTLSGLIPGDLVGQIAKKTVEPTRTVTSFRAAPVALLSGVGTSQPAVSYSAYKPRGASVAAFDTDFKSRLALLNPDLSEIDSGTSRGVMDDVVDRESGLCALARVLKHNQGFINPGDLASLVVVSDEDDADPAGRACLDALIEGKSDQKYVDGVCEVASTKLKYKKAILNPTYAKCKVDFDSGYSYRIDYKYPTTNVEYYTKSMLYDQLKTEVSYYTSAMKYDQLRTNVSYYTSKQAYDAISTPVSYHTKAPTYQIPQTSVKYFTEVESCVIRDGAKTNCKYTYPDFTIVLQGASGANCDAFVAGKLPSDALYNKAGYKPVCSAATPLAKEGACSATDATILNCQQNYSAIKTTTLSGKVTSTCDLFVASRLPAGAVYTDAGYLPSCGNKISDPREGACAITDLDKENCRTVYTLAATPAVLNGVPGSQTCLQFARTKLPSGAVYDGGGETYYPQCSTGTPLVDRTGNCSTTDVNVANCRREYSALKKTTLNGRPGPNGCEATYRSSLPSDTVLGNSTYPINCADAPTVRDVAGNCSTTNTNIENCRTVYSALKTTNLTGAPLAGNCATFVSGRLPSGSVYSDAGYTPNCLPGPSQDKNQTGSQAFTAWPAKTFTKDAACDSEVRDALVASHGLVVTAGTVPSCTVTAISSMNTTLSNSASDLTCSTAMWREVCDNSGGTKRNCRTTDIAAGEKYESAFTTVTHEGAFSCTTNCADTNFCKTSSGTVGDNFYACETTADANVVKSSFVMQPEADTANCAVGQMRRVTRGPYQTDVDRKDYVAGSKSEANEANALSDYIFERSRDLLKEAKPIVSVFVRQPGDPTGTNGSLGTAYNRLADLFGGKKRSVLSSGEQYAEALEDLSAVIRERLNKSIAFQGVDGTLKIRKVWFRRAGTEDWGAPLSSDLWSTSGGTVIFNDSFQFEYGDQFRIEYW